MKSDIAVLIPCLNEEATIERVVRDFRAALPNARICVFDNNSTDSTAKRALAEQAEIWTESRQGKGNVVRRMFAEIEADIYLIVDGDGTYDASSAPLMIQALENERLDMVVAKRIYCRDGTYRSGHQFGNRILSAAVGWIFDSQITDILSGYRVFSRRFVKSFPAMTKGFETETELTIHAEQLRLPIKEISAPYHARQVGSSSKLRTWADGLRILAIIVRLFVIEKPFQFFLTLSLLFFVAATALFVPVLNEYLDTGLVLKFPSLIVAMGGYIMALISLIMGTLLYTAATGRLEAKRFKYLETRPFDSA